MSQNPPPPSDGNAASRRRARSSLFLAGKLKFEGVHGTFDVRIRNLSSSGMMAECAAPVFPGCKVDIETKGLGQITGKVAWVTGGRIGVAFDVEVNPDAAKNPGAVEMAQVTVPDYLKKTAQRPTFRR